jgi:MoxR-like ATPase
MPDPKEFNRFIGTDGYVVSGPLIEAVNCAIALERPLLVKGEPGTGKTLLATHIAKGLGLPIEQWHIKSTSKASEGLYVYDTLQRLNDARFGEGDVGDIRHYIKLGPLGRVFAAKERHVLLIDEVDKNSTRCALPSWRPETRSLPPIGRWSSLPPTTRRSCPTPSFADACSTSSSSQTCHS